MSVGNKGGILFWENRYRKGHTFTSTNHPSAPHRGKSLHSQAKKSLLSIQEIPPYIHFKDVIMRE